MRGKIRKKLLMNQLLSRLMAKISNPGSGLSRLTKTNPKYYSWISGELVIHTQTKFYNFIIYMECLRPFI